MNSKEELHNYISTFNKEPGKYTSEELYAIGCAHKSLPKSEKSWKELCKDVGYFGSPDSYRSFVSRRQKVEGDLPIADKEAISENPTQFESLYKEKTRIRDIYNNYRLSLRNEARLESFKESLCDAIKNLKPLTVSSKGISEKKFNGNCCEAVLLFSDLHLGTNCNNFYNTYNYQVAVERVSKLTRDTISYCNTHKVARLNVINLGDLIAGVIHTNARIQAELNLVDQIAKAAEITSKMLSEFSAAGLNVVYRSCTDNHSRAKENKEENIEAENFNKLIDWYIECRLSASNIVFAHDNIDDSLGKFDLLDGKKIMFAHGHLENVNKCIDAFSGATKEFIDYVLLSHYHSSREKSYNGSKLIINGSIVGTEDYALSKRLFSPAEQKLLIFDNSNLLNISIDLQ